MLTVHSTCAVRIKRKRVCQPQSACWLMPNSKPASRMTAVQRPANCQRQCGLDGAKQRRTLIHSATLQQQTPDDMHACILSSGTSRWGCSAAAPHQMASAVPVASYSVPCTGQVKLEQMLGSGAVLL